MPDGPVRRPGAVIPKVTADPRTAALWFLLEGDTAHARKIVQGLDPGARAAFGVYLATLLILTRDPRPGADLCAWCAHLLAVHDAEGCTAGIPQTEDPDFGPVRTCPCCEKGVLR